MKSVYDLVFDAERPEVFLKAPAYRVPPPGAPLRVRADSTWDVPEPELGLVLTAAGELAGYLVADDVSTPFDRRQDWCLGTKDSMRPSVAPLSGALQRRNW